MIRFCFLIGLSLLLGVGSSSAQTVIELRLSNQSGVNLKLLRGNNPGQGNEDGRLAIGETRTVNSVKGRVWSFMAGNQLVASYRTKQQPEQQFEVTNQMVRKAGVKVPAGGNNMTKPAVNQGGGASNEIRGNIGSSLSRTEATQFLQQHNSARREVDVREVSWSTELARYAQEQADRIARSGKITHTKGTPYGENLGAGSGNYSASKAVAGWYAEKQHFRPGSAAVLTGNKVTGHYTQMVWRRTREIGAGKAVIQKGQYRGWVIVVGIYDPPGNFGGQAPY